MSQDLLDGVLSALRYLEGALASAAIIATIFHQLLPKKVKLSDIARHLWSTWFRRIPLLMIPLSAILYLFLQPRIVRLVFLALAVACTLSVVAILAGQARRILFPKSYNAKRAARFGVRKVIVGGKEFLEQDLLCEILARVIEKGNPGMTVERRFREHGTWSVYSGLQEGEIDLYVEYTGTASVYLRKLPLEEMRQKQVSELRALFRDQHLIMLEPLGYDSRYVIVMLRRKAQELAITCISDLSRHAAELTFKGTYEFDKRPDGFAVLEREYGLHFGAKDIVLEENRYHALRSGAMDVTSGFAADREIILEKDTFAKLRDDRELFPSNYAAPLVHQDLLDAFPNIEKSLAKLEGAISEKEIANLTHEATEKGFDRKLDPTGIRMLVNRFLRDKNL
jgi:osmoprotectant transport system substrate-binding protein